MELSRIIYPEMDQLNSFKNKLVNGAFEINQRGVSSTESVYGITNEYFLDMWKLYNTSGGTSDIHRRSHNDEDIGRYMEIAPNSVATCETTEIIYTQQLIEGNSCIDLLNSKIAISFWVYASRAGTFFVALQDNTASKSYITRVTVNAANTWEYKRIENIPSLSSGGLTFPASKGNHWLKLFIILSAGSSYTSSTYDQWVSGSHICNSSVQTDFQQTGDVFRLANVQLEPNSVATDFEHRPYEVELEICRRYYEEILFWYSTCISATANTGRSSIQYRTRKVCSPTVQLGQAGTKSYFYNSAWQAGTSIAFASDSYGLRAVITGTIGHMTVPNVYMGHFRCRCECSF